MIDVFDEVWNEAFGEVWQFSGGVASADIRSPDYTLIGPQSRRHEINGPRTNHHTLKSGSERITLDGTRR